MVQDIVPGCSVKYLEGGAPDPRCYRVNCDKLTSTLPRFRTEWTVRRGIEELYESFVRYGLTREAFGRCIRLKRIQELVSDDQLDSQLRWRRVPAVA
jgi:hypothetical protein